ncbi:helix-turn-helix transcriptional regulator [Ramlibacter terrae]|uniref:Helix-turn-helix transcriptional regulator n=1 Tax=Ramlibacter terrae TaxID=2732511 RepID=A0ABX6P5A0_9BURK|nr:helix-turn-helix transcriptional regulator [Ramlibacter terrae]
MFWALSDATRRGVVEQLARGPASVSDLAQPHGMSLPGFMKHLRVLEDAGLVQREKEGRTVRCALAPGALEDAAMWLAHYEKFWTAQLDALGRYLYHREEVKPWPGEPSARSRSSTSSGAIPSPVTKSGPRGPTRKR